MSTRRKADAKAIRQFLRDQRDLPWLGQQREFWPHFVFRSDDVRNTAEILNSGVLMSRKGADDAGVIKVDAAASNIVGGLSDEESDFARLYFRPKAPTQYHNEGIRPVDKYYRDAHMPVPVYMLFDSIDVLTRTGVKVTNGRHGSGADEGSSANFLRSMDWKNIYHLGAIRPQSMIGEVTAAKHAEILVPKGLPLDALRAIYCRCLSERETLLNLLAEEDRNKWQERILVEGRVSLFQRRGTYVESVELDSTQSVVSFYNQTDYGFDGPFNVAFEWTEVGGDGSPWMFQRTRTDFYVSQNPKTRFRFRNPHPYYELKVTINGDLAYLGRYEDSAAPDVFS